MNKWFPGFQLQLSRKDINRAEQSRRLFGEKLVEHRDVLRKKVKEELLLSTVYSIGKKGDFIPNGFVLKTGWQRCLRDRAGLCGMNFLIVLLHWTVFNCLILSWNFLSLGPKHLIRDKINEVQCLLGVDRLVRELRENKTDGEKIVR